MKTNWFKKGFALLAGMAAMSACSSDGDNDKPKAPEFPEKQTVEIAAGETQTLTFKADADWKLTVDKTWCRFMDGAVETAQLQGKAGNQTVEVMVKDLNQDFDAATAKIDLSMGSMSRTIFEITRPGMVREVKMYEKTGFGSAATIDPAERVSLTFDGRSAESKEIGFTANFDWKVKELPAGVELEPALAGNAGVTPDSKEFKTARITVAAEREPYTLNGEIVISDLEGNHSVSFPFSYDGMGDGDIKFSPMSVKTSGGVKFSAEGKLLDKGTGEPTAATSIPFAVAVKEMKYKAAIVELDEQNRPQTVTTGSWLQVEDDRKGNITLSVAANENSERKCYLYLLPEGIAANYDYAKDFDGDWQTNDDYSVPVTQEGVAVAGEGGFYVYWAGEGGGLVPDGKIVPFSEYDMGYGTGNNPGDMFYGAPADNTYVYEFSNETIIGQLAFYPKGFPEGWDPTYPDELYSFYDLGEWPTDKISGDAYIYVGGGLQGNTYHTIGFNPEDLKEEKLASGSMVGVYFYENAEDKELYRPKSVLVLYKK